MKAEGGRNLIHHSSLITHHSPPGVSVQDGGRRGYAALGLPQSGPLDPYAHAAANLLLGNAADSAAVEVVGIGEGPSFYCEVGCLVAIAGADLGVAAGGRRVPLWHTLWLRSGETLCFSGRTNIEGTGGVAYLAVAGGLQLPRYLGSRSAYLGAAGALPGLAGRYLQAGDTLTIEKRGRAEQGGRAWPLDEPIAYPGVAPLAIIWGPHPNRLGPSGKAALLAQQWTVAESNRMGARLAGAPLPVSGGELVSAAVVRGAVQLPPSGLPIVLGPDHQTTGGYPIVAVVTRASWPQLGQLLPGDMIRFRAVTLMEAQQRARLIQARLSGAARLLAQAPQADYAHT
jgi:antagonist of KipI